MAEKKLLGWLLTIIYSYGGDTPEEVYWGLNEMIEWLNAEHDFKLLELEHPFWEGYSADDYDDDARLSALSDALKSLTTLTPAH